MPKGRMASRIDSPMDQSSFTEAEQKEWSTLCKQKEFLLSRVNEEKAKIIPKKSDTVVNLCKKTIESKKSAIAAKEAQIISLTEEIKRYKLIIEQQERTLQERIEYLETPRSPALAAAEEKLRQQQEKMDRFRGIKPPLTPALPAVPQRSEPKKVVVEESETESEYCDTENDEAPPIISEEPPQPPLTQSRSASKPRQSKPVESDSEDERQSAMKAFFSDDSFRMAPRHFAPQYDVDRPRVIQNTKKMPKRAISLSHNR